MKYLNNPGNIRYSKYNCWLGQNKPRNGFCRFAKLDYGVRAMILLLNRYIREGVNTPQLIINRYAPSVENNSDAYIKFVSGKMDIFPFDLITKENFPDLVKHMCWFESRTNIASFYVLQVIHDYKIKMWYEKRNC